MARTSAVLAEYSSLPGWLMPAPGQGGVPQPAHVVDYLSRYEKRYQVRVRHGTTVLQVCRADDDPHGRLALDCDWTGPGSAIPTGIGRTAREAVAEITAALA